MHIIIEIVLFVFIDINFYEKYPPPCLSLQRSRIRSELEADLEVSVCCVLIQIVWGMGGLDVVAKVMLEIVVEVVAKVVVVLVVVVAVVVQAVVVHGHVVVVRVYCVWCGWWCC